MSPRGVRRLSEQARGRFGIEIAVRVELTGGLGVSGHCEDDVMDWPRIWLAGSRDWLSLGAVVVSMQSRMFIHNDFELEARPPAPVKGVEELISDYRVASERAWAARSGSRPVGRP